MYVRMDLARILITEHGGNQLIYLREKDGQRTFPIIIGTMEAMAIERRINRISTPRPMTHDLLASVISALGGELEKIVINDLQQDEQTGHGTFIATLYIRTNGELIEVDSRPSDAIALGSGLDTPIYVAQHVLENVTAGPASQEERLEFLRAHLKILDDKIADVTKRLKDSEFIDGASEELIREHHKLLETMKTERSAIRKVLEKFS